MSTNNNSSPNSRYYGIEIGAVKKSDGSSIPYLRRRFVPAQERFAVLGEHTLVDRERLDNISAHYLGDPEQFWRICDGNGAMRAEELETAHESQRENIGRRVLITLPEEIPGAPTDR